jgi:hypothetical protein
MQTMRQRHTWWWLTVGGLVLATPSFAACGSVECSQAGATDTIIGRLVARDGATATFSIESVLQSSAGPRSAPPPPVLKPGQTVAVRYFANRARFLHVGTRYRVALYWSSNGYFESGVHVSGDPCSGGTVYANGHRINTSGWVRSHLGFLIVAFALVPLVFALLFIVAMSRVFARRRAARNRS